MTLEPNPTFQKKKLKHFIEEKYNLEIVKIVHTVFEKDHYIYEIIDSGGKEYILKILFKKEHREFSLSAERNRLKHEFNVMFRCQLDFVSYPVVTVNGNFVIDFTDHIITLHTKNPGYTPSKLSPSELEDLGRKIATLHHCYKDIPKRMFAREKLHLKEYIKLTNTYFGSQVLAKKDSFTKKFQKLILKYKEDIQSATKELLSLQKRLELKKSLMLTHGDITSSTVITDGHKMSITNLENLSYARREKDLSSFTDKKDFEHIMKGYRTVFSKVKVPEKLLLFYYTLHLVEDLIERSYDLLENNHRIIKKRALKTLQREILPQLKMRGERISELKEFL